MSGRHHRGIRRAISASCIDTRVFSKVRSSGKREVLREREREVEREREGLRERGTERERARHPFTHTHTHALTLTRSFPFPTPPCSGRKRTCVACTRIGSHRTRAHKPQGLPVPQSPPPQPVLLLLLLHNAHGKAKLCLQAKRQPQTMRMRQQQQPVVLTTSRPHLRCRRVCSLRSSGPSANRTRCKAFQKAPPSQPLRH